MSVYFESTGIEHRTILIGNHEGIGSLRHVERLREKVAIHINEQHYLWPAAQREANKM